MPLLLNMPLAPLFTPNYTCLLPPKSQPSFECKFVFNIKIFFTQKLHSWVETKSQVYIPLLDPYQNLIFNLQRNFCPHIQHPQQAVTWKTFLLC